MLKELTSFFSLVLWAAAGLAFFAQWRDPGQKMGEVGWAVIAVILVSAAFSFWQEYRAERLLAELRKWITRRLTPRLSDAADRQSARDC